MIVLYLLICLLTAWVLFADGAEALAEDLFPTLFPRWPLTETNVRHLAIGFWVLFTLVAFARGWI